MTRLGLAANMSLSLAPAPSAGHGLKEATLQARVYLHNVPYYTIQYGGEGKGGDRQAAADDEDDGGAE